MHALGLGLIYVLDSRFQQEFFFPAEGTCDDMFDDKRVGIHLIRE